MTFMVINKPKHKASFTSFLGALRTLCGKRAFFSPIARKQEKAGRISSRPISVFQPDIPSMALYSSSISLA